jgi:uncharacterized membrane protein
MANGIFDSSRKPFIPAKFLKNMNSKKILFIILIVLMVFEILISSYLIYEDKTKPVASVCIMGSSCESVQTSVYGKIFGIKLPYYALGAFSLLLLLFFISKKLYYAGTITGSLCSLYLIVIQLFVLKQICSTCMLIDITMFSILVLSFFYFKK